MWIEFKRANALGCFIAKDVIGVVDVKLDALICPSAVAVPVEHALEIFVALPGPFRGAFYRKLKFEWDFEGFKLVLV